MKKFVKRALLSLVVFVVLLLAAAIAIPFLFRDKIEAAIKEEVNNNLLADVDWGRWSFSLLRSFPNMSASVSDVLITNRAPFEGVELADIGRFSVTLDIKSLWREELEILKVKLDQPNIHVVVLKDGTANYNITKPAEESAESSAFQISLREYAISDGRGVYEDRSQGIMAEIFDLDHSGSGNFTQDLFTLKTKTGVGKLDVKYGGIQYVRRASVDLAADIAVDLNTNTYTFSENEVSINDLVLGFEGWLSQPGSGYDMDIQFRSKRSDLANILSLIPAEFASDLKGVEMSGTTSLQGSLKGLYKDDALPAFTLLASVDNGRFKYPSLPQSAEDIFLDLNIQHPGGANLDRMVIDLKKLNMNLAGNPLSARLKLSNTVSDPLIDAEVKSNMDLSNIGQVIPMEEELRGRLDADVRLKGALSSIEQQRYESFEADGNLSITDMVYEGESVAVPLLINSLLFEFSPRFLSLNSFDGSMGSTKLQASGRLNNYLEWWLKDQMLTGSFDVKADRVNLNELMGASPGPSPEEDNEPGGEGSASTMQVIEIPENLNISLTASANQVIYDNLTLDKVRGSLKVRESRLELSELLFNLFGGSVAVSGAYDTKNPKAPGIDLRYDIRDMDIVQSAQAISTLDRLAPIARYSKGKFSTNLSLKGVLNEQMEPVMSSLTGRGTLRSQQVTVSGFKPLDQLASVLSLPALAKASLQNLNLTYKIENGQMITEPFDIKIDRMQAKVGGSMAIEDQSLNYTMSSKIPTAMFGASPNQTVGSLLGINQQGLAGFSLPDALDATIAFTGTIDNPVIKPVFAGGMKDMLESAVEQVKDQVIEEVGERVDQAREDAVARARQERDKLIADAQKQADKIKADARTEAAKVKDAAYKAADSELEKVKNPLAKAGAKLVADKAKAEADKKEQQAIAEADKRADAIVDTARKQGDELVKKAEQQ